jgi:hypothetical protein
MVKWFSACLKHKMGLLASGLSSEHPTKIVISRLGVYKAYTVSINQLDGCPKRNGLNHWESSGLFGPSQTLLYTALEQNVELLGFKQNTKGGLKK